MSAVVGDGVEFVELVLAETFGAEAGDTKTKTRDDEDDECGKNECFAVCQDTTSGEELRPQTGSDGGVSVCRQIQTSQPKRERVSKTLVGCQKGIGTGLHDNLVILSPWTKPN